MGVEYFAGARIEDRGYPNQPQLPAGLEGSSFRVDSPVSDKLSHYRNLAPVDRDRYESDCASVDCRQQRHDSDNYIEFLEEIIGYDQRIRDREQTFNSLRAGMGSFRGTLKRRIIEYHTTTSLGHAAGIAAAPFTLGATLLLSGASHAATAAIFNDLTSHHVDSTVWLHQPKIEASSRDFRQLLQDRKGAITKKYGIYGWEFMSSSAARSDSTAIRYLRSLRRIGSTPHNIQTTYSKNGVTSASLAFELARINETVNTLRLRPLPPPPVADVTRAGVSSRPPPAYEYSSSSNAKLWMGVGMTMLAAFLCRERIFAMAPLLMSMARTHPWTSVRIAARAGAGAAYAVGGSGKVAAFTLGHLLSGGGKALYHTAAITGTGVKYAGLGLAKTVYHTGRLGGLGMYHVAGGIAKISFNAARLATVLAGRAAYGTLRVAFYAAELGLRLPVAGIRAVTGRWGPAAGGLAIAAVAVSPIVVAGLKAEFAQAPKLRKKTRRFRDLGEMEDLRRPVGVSYRNNL